MNRPILNDRYWIHVGYSKRIAFGFAIDKWSFNLDFGPFWFGLEW